MRFKADEIVSVLTGEIENYRSQADVREVGRVLEVSDGIARVHGLTAVMSGEMVEFTRSGVRGLAFNLEDGVVKVWTTGGTDGTTYKITATVTTQGSRVKQAEIKIKVKEY